MARTLVDSDVSHGQYADTIGRARCKVQLLTDPASPCALTVADVIMSPRPVAEALLRYVSDRVVEGERSLVAALVELNAVAAECVAIEARDSGDAKNALRLCDEVLDSVALLRSRLRGSR